MNTRIENKMTNILEPLMSIAFDLGISYEHGFLEVIWKLLLKNHAHDSMGMCCSDKVHREIKARYQEAEERCDRLIDFYKRKIIEAAPDRADMDKLGFFNFLPQKKNHLVKTEVTTRMSGFALEDINGNKVEFHLRKVTELEPGLIDRQIVHYGKYKPLYRYEIEFLRELPAMYYEVLFIKEAECPEINFVSVDRGETYYFTILPNADGTVDITDKNENCS